MIDILINGVITDYPQSIAEYIHLKDEIVNLEYHQDQLTEKGKKSFNALKESIKNFEEENKEYIQKVIL